MRKKVKVFKVNLKLYRFALRFAVLTAGVAIGALLLWHFGHAEYQALLGAGGVARALELAGEAAADAVDDYV